MVLQAPGTASLFAHPTKASAATMALTKEIAGLFQGALEEFIPSRDALARRLAGEGQDDDARTVKALRKPTVPAWVLDQLGARDPDGIDALLDAGKDLREAQTATISSPENAGALREATEARRSAIARLARVAEEILAERGASGVHADVIASGLEAASVDDEAGTRLRDGTLSRPPTPATGLGDGPTLTSLPVGDEASGVATAAKARIARLRRERDAAERAARKDRASADSHADEVATITERLASAKKERAAAERRARHAEHELEKAEEALRLAEGPQPD